MYQCRFLPENALSHSRNLRHRIDDFPRLYGTDRIRLRVRTRLPGAVGRAGKSRSPAACFAAAKLLRSKQGIDIVTHLQISDQWC